ncbi:hypothetical protein GGS23DRAFT_614024 [Durotheca rogersii]|uniref:uncharacterized protein n=1 Tax=Durotheca rogersii TaxID=419775 RepID=UPI002220918A|nr:uncharacterized protein GGS23DRAFT_614024 [Durotheca rogersii]KAI5860442.1 hypothetical protein GGS23DRAFT_614024 [Durotheca rogersii]
MGSRQTRYANLAQGHAVDDRDDARSSTEVEDSLMGDDHGGKEWHDVELDGRSALAGLPRGRRTLRARLAAAAGTARWALDTALLLVILGLLLRDQARQPTTAAPQGAASSLAVGDVNPWQFGQDLTGVGPRFSQEITTFVRDESYAPNDTASFFTDEVLQRWNDLMPKGMGFVWVNDTSKYHDLPTPIMWPEKTVFTTSATHQLHCLFAIVQTYSGMSSGHEIPDDHHWHMIHCFDYMRQAIMCSADMALEGLETTFPDHNGGSDGWDSKHVCRNWNDVKSYLESVRAYDDKLIY